MRPPRERLGRLRGRQQPWAGQRWTDHQRHGGAHRDHTFNLPATSALLVACGADSACAVATDGQAWCWGRNLGLTATLTGGKPGETPASIRAPAAVTGLKNVAELVATGRAYCARTNTKGGAAVWCFGDGRGGVEVALPLELSASRL